jgi:hypothetical protein
LVYLHPDIAFLGTTPFVVTQVPRNIRLNNPVSKPSTPTKVKRNPTNTS